MGEKHFEHVRIRRGSVFCDFRVFNRGYPDQGGPKTFRHDFLLYKKDLENMALVLSAPGPGVLVEPEPAGISRWIDSALQFFPFHLQFLREPGGGDPLVPGYPVVPGH